MEDYLFKSSLAIVLLYLVYQVIIRYEPNHQLNRIIGLACLLFSTGFLFIPVEGLFTSYEPNEAINVIVQGASDIQTKFINVSTPDSVPIYTIIYLLGVGLFAFRSLIGLGTLIFHYFNAKKYPQWGFTVVVLEKDVSPFTFFNLLFIGKQRLEGGNLDVMLVHEQVHRDQLHSLDALILEGLTIVFWFNPFIWLFQRDIKAEHEFLADAQVLKKGISKSDYQHFLFEARTGVSIQLGNYLSNKTSLSKRFNMMTYKKFNAKMSYARAGISLLMMAFILFISACAVMDSQVDVPAEYKEGLPALYKTVGDNIKYPKSARETNSSGKLYVSFTINSEGKIEDVVAEKRNGYMLDGVVVTAFAVLTEPVLSAGPTDLNDDIKAEAVRTVKLLSKGEFTPAQKDGHPVSSTLVLPITFKLAN
ncbi:MAG: M56 family metallopeptidase [Bacteroidota bacterium]